jgi:hypothetical protein
VKILEKRVFIIFELGKGNIGDFIQIARKNNYRQEKFPQLQRITTDTKKNEENSKIF